MTDPHDARIREHYKSRIVLGLSLIQLVIGCVCVIAHVILLQSESLLAFIGHGIWAGMTFITSASFGVASSFTKTKLSVVAFMVTSIISAIITIGLLGLSGIDWKIFNWAVSTCGDGCIIHPRHFRTYLYPVATMTILALVEALLAIISIILACSVICGGHIQQVTPGIPGQVHYITGPNGQQQAVIMPVGQQPQAYMPNTAPYNPGYGPPAKEAHPGPAMA